MPTYDVTVGGIDYEVDAPDEGTAWQYANYTHQSQGAAQPAGVEQRAQPDMAQKAMDTAAPIVRGALPAIATYGAGALAATAIGAPAAIGGGALAVGAMLAEPLILGVNKFFGTRIATPTEAWNTLMDNAGIPASTTEGAKLLEQIAAGGAGALTMRGAGALLQATASPRARAIGAALSSNMGQQVVAGMGAGAAGEAARYEAEQLGFEEGGQAVAQLAGGLVGGMTAAKIATPRSIGAPQYKVPGMASDRVAKAVAAAEAEGKTVMTSDLYPPETKWQKLKQEVQESTPLGTAAPRSVQQKQRIKTVSDLLSDYGAAADSNVIDDVMKSLGRTRADNLANWTNQKNNIVSRVSAATTPVQATEIASTLNTIRSEANRLAGINATHYAPAISKLQQFRSALLGDEILDPATGAILGYAGKPFDQVEANLKVIGSSMSKDPSLAHIKTDFEKIATKVRKALRSDVYDYIKAAESPAVAREWGKANEEIYSMIKETESAAFSSVLRRGTANPEIVERLLKSTKPSDVRILVNNLDTAGIDNAKSALLSMVAKEAMLKDETLSIPKFINGIQKYSKQMGIIFTPDEFAQIKGKVDYLNITNRGESFNADPQTGARLTMPLFAQMFAGAVGGLKALAIAPTIGLGARAYESATTRNLLSQLSRVTSTPEKMSFVKRIAESVDKDQLRYITDQTKNQQMTFLPETTQQEQLGKGMSATDSTTGYRMLSRDGKKFGLYGPDNQRIGIFSSQEDARKRAEKEFRKRK